jgi:hypothetical protein
MEININPKRINTGSAGAGKSSIGKRQTASPEAPVIIPQRAHVNIIPEPESLATMIRSAIAALRQGTFWDRGTIVNLLV